MLRTCINLNKSLQLIVNNFAIHPEASKIHPRYLQIFLPFRSSRSRVI